MNSKKSAPGERRSILIVAGALACAGAGACAPPPPPESCPAPEPEIVVLMDTVFVEASGDVELAQRAARLQTQLMDRDAQIAVLEGQLDQATDEAVRTMAKLRTLATRAEAASALAEAEIAIEALRSESGGVSSATITHAADLLAQSTAAFEAENYGGSVYLSTDAKMYARAAQARTTEGIADALLPNEEPFRLPIKMETVTRSNVRKGPSLRHGVLFTLDPNTALVGYSYTDQWVRISSADGRNGWIFHDLVRRRVLDRP
jgi:Bacterial SH3 domain